MNARRWMLCAGLVGLLIGCAGCLSDDVVYVDENGRQLAVDENGKPILPGQAGSGAEQAPPAAGQLEWPVRPQRTSPANRSPGPGTTAGTQAPVAAPNGAPTPDPSWDLPSEKSSKSQPATATPKPAKPVESSDALDSPPAKR